MIKDEEVERLSTTPLMELELEDFKKAMAINITQNQSWQKMIEVKIDQLAGIIETMEVRLNKKIDNLVAVDNGLGVKIQEIQQENALLKNNINKQLTEIIDKHE